MDRKEVIEEFCASKSRFGSFIGKLFPDDYIQGVEVGVFRGDHALLMLGSHPKLIYSGVDMWEKHSQENSSYLSSSGCLPSKFSSENLAKLFRKEAEDKLKCFSTRVSLFCESSYNSAKRWPNEFLDFVYIDADHTYAACLSDLITWWPKIKKGGIVAGHDWGCQGVSKALVEFFGEEVPHNSVENIKGICWLKEKF